MAWSATSSNLFIKQPLPVTEISSIKADKCLYLVKSYVPVWKTKDFWRNTNDFPHFSHCPQKRNMCTRGLMDRYDASLHWRLRCVENPRQRAWRHANHKTHSLAYLQLEWKGTRFVPACFQAHYCSALGGSYKMETKNNQKWIWRSLLLSTNVGAQSMPHITGLINVTIMLNKHNTPMVK